MEEIIDDNLLDLAVAPFSGKTLYYLTSTYIPDEANVASFKKLNA